MNEQDNFTNFFRFEELRIYAKAMDYIEWLYHHLDVNAMDSNNNFCINRFKDAFLKSANSIAIQMAEGSSRNKAQFLYYLKLAKSAVRECVFYTDMALRLQLMDEESRNYSRTQLIELTKMVGSLIVSLQRSMVGAAKPEKKETEDLEFPEFD